MTSPKRLAKKIETVVHGDYLLRVPESDPPWPLLVGFHGYGETAEIMMRRLEAIPQADNWLLCAVQALHPFYTESGREVGASWMTRLDREDAIRENVDYVDRVVEAVAREFATTDTLVFAGFSQGTAMACRAAALGRAASSGIVLVGGDLPEELKTPAGLRRAHCALIGRGLEDRFLTAERMERDAGRLREAGVAVRTESVAGGHEWNASMGWVVGDFLLGLWEMELNEAPVDADPGRHDNGGDRAE